MRFADYAESNVKSIVELFNCLDTIKSFGGGIRTRVRTPNLEID